MANLPLKLVQVLVSETENEAEKLRERAQKLEDSAKSAIESLPFEVVKEELMQLSRDAWKFEHGNKRAWSYSTKAFSPLHIHVWPDRINITWGEKGGTYYEGDEAKQLHAYLTHLRV